MGGVLGQVLLHLHSGVDAVAIAEAIWPGTLKCRRPAVDVVCGSAAARGATVIDTRSGYGALDAYIDALRDVLSPHSLWSRHLYSPQPPPLNASPRGRQSYAPRA